MFKHTHSTLLELVKCCECGPWGSVHETFFDAYKWARFMHTTRPKRLTSDKHSSLLAYLQVVECCKAFCQMKWVALLAKKKYQVVQAM